MTARASILIALAPALAACAPPPVADAATGRLGLALVSDSAIFKVVQVWQIHVVKAQTATGASVTCSDIPGNYRPGDGVLVPVLDPPKNIPWSGGTDEAKVQRFDVPVDTKLVIVVKGLALYASGVHSAAAGCQDNLTFKADTTTDVTVDVKATTGAACNSQPECEPALICHKGPDFNGGYCAKLGCAGDQDCPPGAVCASDGALGGICLRRCETQRDCTVDTAKGQLVQACEGRLGPTAGGCAEVCVYPLWNKSNKCP
jgi:hypothetical protein